MRDSNFLCGNCRRVLCFDCGEIADEYAELLAMRNRSLFERDAKIERLELELQQAQRRADDYKHILELGINPLILAWMRSNDTSKLYELAKAEAKV